MCRVLKIPKSVYFKFTIICFTSILIYSCNKIDDKLIQKTEEDSFESTIEKVEHKNNVEVVEIDSIRMHAIDNLYFGKNPGTTSRKFLVDNMEYNVKKSMGNPVYYYMLENSSTITTKNKADRILKELKDIIAKKYNNGIFLNRTYYTKHPEEKEKNRSSFEQRSIGEFDKNIVGEPYEFAGYKWDLKYKTIQIGYFIENKNRSIYMQSTPKDNYYIVYIELTSKFNIPKVTDNTIKQKEKDSSKF
jgi:hypothetical protein